MVLIGTVQGGQFLLEEATDMIRAEFKKFPGLMSIPHLCELTGLDADGVMVILCYLEHFHEITTRVENQCVKWIKREPC